MDKTPSSVVERLRAAVDARDLDALVDCFAESYRNETPAHPRRGFEGRAQVRTNWQRIFEGVPDVRAEVLRTATDGDLIWSEWQMSGTRRDGQAHLMCGVIIFGVTDGRFQWARFYLEPADPTDDGNVDVAVGRLLHDAQPSGPA